jgi:hypothetical protein
MISLLPDPAPVQLAEHVPSPAYEVTIDRYGDRNFAVYLDGELLAVTVYKKGARAVADAITRLASEAKKETVLSIVK